MRYDIQPLEEQENSDMPTLSSFIKENQSDMLEYLTDIVATLKEDIKANPSLYEESIDIRLCIDLDRHSNPTWIFRIGSSDYDQVHSEYCAASSVGLDTDPVSLFEELVSQLEEYL
jgi:hypothetical protein